MKISTKGRYAIRVLLDLAEHSGEHYISTKDIAKRQGITVKYLEHIVALLTKAGYIKSLRGSQGGYQLTRQPENYTLWEILETAEGSLAPVTCLEDQPNTCPRADTCPTLPLWEGLNDVVRHYLEHYTLADLVDNKKQRHF